MSRRVAGRAFAWLVLAAGLLETLYLNLYTLRQVARAHTVVPWWGEWALVGDLAQIYRGQPVWRVLWAPYWGERQVVTRLLWLANARFNALGSQTWLTMLFQFALIGVMTRVAWVLAGRSAKTPFLVACVVILNLLLSPFQMWDFVWSTQAMFVLAPLAATCSFVCFALAGGRRNLVWTGLAMGLATLSVLTMPNGLLVWLVLVLEALFLKRGRRVTAMLALLGAIATGLYLWHYTRPDMGMGVGGMFRHPIDAMLLVGVVVAGPVGFISNATAAVVGVIALGVTAYVCIVALRLEVPERPWLAAVVGLILFQSISAISVVAGRLDPRFLGHDPIYTVPVRYPGLVTVLWTAVALLVLYTCWRQKVRPWLLAVCAPFFFYLTFGTTLRQYNLAEDWTDFFRGADAVGAALLIDAHDEQLLARLWPEQAELKERTVFLRENKLAMFHEPRAGWMGQDIGQVFPSSGTADCSGAIEKTTPFGGFARVQGWAWDRKNGEGPDYILLTDASGRIIGHGRGGLRHGYIPGLLIEAGSVPASHSAFRHSEWLGFVQLGQAARLFGVFAGGNRVCEIRP